MRRSPSAAAEGEPPVTPASPPRARGATISWVLLALISVVALVIGSARSAGPATADERVTGLARSIKCPTCQGESVAESDAGPSREIRRDIAVRVQQGESDEDIRAYYADRYGDQILLTPPRSGLGALVWVIPVLVGLGAVAGLVMAFRRWRAEPKLVASDEDRALVARALRDMSAGDIAGDTQGDTARDAEGDRGR